MKVRCTQLQAAIKQLRRCIYEQCDSDTDLLSQLLTLGAGSGPPSLVGDGNKGAGLSPRTSMGHQGPEITGQGPGLLPAYVPPNYSPMKASRVATGPVPTANLLAQDIPGLQVSSQSCKCCISRGWY